MTTANDLITAALREAAILGDNETPSAATAAAALGRLNRMLDSWRNNKTIVYHILEQQFTFTANEESYTIGSGGDFDGERPLELMQPCYVRENGYDYPLKILEKEAYGRISNKDSVFTNYPRYVYYDPQYPLGVLKFYPAPNTTNTVFLNSPAQLQSFSALTTNVALPPGYEDAIVYNLAIRSAAKKGFTINPLTAQLAAEALAMVKATNIKPLISRLDLINVGYGHSYDTHSDTY